ncbi:MAG: capsular polysaccharide biosynthesis protein [Lachnospiraceae bacterium]|nr:capsular polysaccharide biosynthesis protein [Lachnospiraceae bacterium]
MADTSMDMVMEGNRWPLNGWADLHCHVLPGMDDGCGDCEESAAVLTESLKQGIRGIAATPHYYPTESVERFLERRLQSYEKLRRYLDGQELETPEICLGAEVAYRTGISREPLLEKLCYGSSGYLLLELPFQRWSRSVLQEIRMIRNVRGITPVIAHLERYLKFQDKKTLSELFDMDVCIQMNAGYLLGRWTRSRAKRMIRNGVIQILGSDCHNMETRLPNLGMAVRQMEKSRLSREAEEIRRFGMEIFQEAVNN